MRKQILLGSSALACLLSMQAYALNPRVCGTLCGGNACSNPDTYTKCKDLCIPYSPIFLACQKIGAPAGPTPVNTPPVNTPPVNTPPVNAPPVNTPPAGTGTPLSADAAELARQLAAAHETIADLTRQIAALGDQLDIDTLPTLNIDLPAFNTSYIYNTQIIPVDPALQRRLDTTVVAARDAAINLRDNIPANIQVIFRRGITQQMQTLIDELNAPHLNPNNVALLANTILTRGGGGGASLNQIPQNNPHLTALTAALNNLKQAISDTEGNQVAIEYNQRQQALATEFQTIKPLDNELLNLVHNHTQALQTLLDLPQIQNAVQGAGGMMAGGGFIVKTALPDIIRFLKEFKIPQLHQFFESKLPGTRLLVKDFMPIDFRAAGLGRDDRYPDFLNDLAAYERNRDTLTQKKKVLLALHLKRTAEQAFLQAGGQAHDLTLTGDARTAFEHALQPDTPLTFAYKLIKSSATEAYLENPPFGGIQFAPAPRGGGAPAPLPLGPALGAGAPPPPPPPLPPPRIVNP